MIVAQILIIYVGYVWPVLRSIDAIQSRRQEDVRNCLLYWSVLALVLVIEFALGSIQTILLGNKSYIHWIVRLGVLIWLNHSHTSGSQFLYRNIFRDIFAKYETQLDSFVRVTTERTQDAVLRQAQLITWQLLLSPSEGILSVVWKSVQPLIGAVVSASRANLVSFGVLPNPAAASKVDGTENLTRKSSVSHSVLRRQPSGRSLSRALLEQFTQLLRDEITVDAGVSMRSMRPCQVTLVRHESALCLSSVRSSKVVSGDDLELFLQFPLVNITDVCLHPSLACVIAVKYLPVARRSASGNTAVPPSTVLVRAEDEAESEALLAGLQMLATSARAIAVGAFTDAANALDTAALRHQFAVWRKLSRNATKEKLK